MNAGARILLTGATGFLGKVVLGELLRRDGRGSSHDIDRIFVLVRSKGGASAESRFERLTQSPCFARQASNWQARVEPVFGNLNQPRCGLVGDVYRRLCGQVTHVVHCAASVDFDLPLAQACQSNILATLNVLALAGECQRLARMVSVSTAYVTPHRQGPLPQALVPLPQPAESLLAEMLAGRTPKADILARTGHANTYTLTKCVAEHLLAQRRGRAPLTIVRPSIIAAAWRHPFPGWIDSPAALAGFIMSIGVGAMHVLNAGRKTRLDVVPVDGVAECIIQETLAAADAAPPAAPPRIVHAVAGLAQAATVGQWVGAIESHFRRYPAGRPARVAFMGRPGWRFRVERLLHHQLPAWLHQGYHRARGHVAKVRQARRALDRIDSINRVFPYFTHRSFDFEAGGPPPEDFALAAYLRQVCGGVSRHLLGSDPRRVPLAGAAGPRRASVLGWALSRRRGSLPTRLSAWVLTHVLAKIFAEVSVDQASFEDVMAQVRARHGDGVRLVVVPSHRSYVDFLAAGYLFFAKSHLGVPIPEVAAAEEFARIAVVGPLFRRLGAFFIRRGGQGADPKLTAQLARLVAERITLEFFVEGKRSRSRHFLAPRRGLLRALQSSGEPFVVLPVAFSYDRVPEEGAFARELHGHAAAGMRLGPLLAWARTMLRGEVALGRLHIACAPGMLLTPTTCVHGFARDLTAALQAQTTLSDFHLRHFCATHPELDLDPGWLRAAIEARGGTVLPSPLATSALPLADAALGRTLQHQWEHFFFADAQAVAPGNVALERYIAAFGYAAQPLAVAITDARLDALLGALFQPLCQDAVRLARVLAAMAGRRRATVAQAQVMRWATGVDRTRALWLVDTWVELGLVARADPSHLEILAPPQAFRRFAEAAVWGTPRAAGRRLARTRGAQAAPA